MTDKTATETSNLDLTARLQAIVEGGEPDKSGRGYVLNLLAESCIEIKRLNDELAVAYTSARAILAQGGKLRGALREVLEQNDLTCLRASEEISEAEGCPCPNCVAERLLRPPAAPESRDG